MTNIAPGMYQDTSGLFPATLPGHPVRRMVTARPGCLEIRMWFDPRKSSAPRTHMNLTAPPGHEPTIQPAPGT